MPKRTVYEGLAGYTVAGARVLVGDPGVPATVVRQGGVGPNALFLVRLDEPVSFNEYARKATSQSVKGMTRQQRIDALFDQLLSTGCVRERREGEVKWPTWPVDRWVVECLWVFWDKLTVPNPAAGGLFEYIEGTNAWQGRVRGRSGGAIIFDLFEPTPGVVAPHAAALAGARPGDYEPYSLAIAGWAANRLEECGSLPDGRWEKDQKAAGNYSPTGAIYVLAEPAAIDGLAKALDECTLDESASLRSRTYTTFRLDSKQSELDQGTFRPMREDWADYYAGAITAAEATEAAHPEDAPE